MPLQIPQLDDRSFEQILAEAVARIPVHTPEWNNFNDSDPGMTLVQLFAFMTENLLYRSNRIPEANRLKFLTLLGLPLRPATAARGLVVFTNDRGPAQPLPFDAGMELFAGNVPFRTRTDVNILPVTAEVFYKKPKSLEELKESDPEIEERYQEMYALNDDQPLTFYQAMPLKPPQAGQKELPEINISNDTETIDKALWMALVAPKNIPVTLARDVIAGETLSLGVYPSAWTVSKVLEAQSLEPKKSTAGLSGLIFDAAVLVKAGDGKNPPQVGYKRLEIESAEDILEMPGVVQLKLPGKAEIKPYIEWNFDPIEEGLSDLPPFIEDNELAQRIVMWIRIRVAANAESGGSSSQRGRIAWVGVNTARVIQALRVENERLGVGTGTPNQTLKVTNTPVITEAMTQTQPGQTPERTFQLQVTNENGTLETWRLTDDLYAEKPDAKVYSLDAESGQVTFGDGLRGARPPRSSSIRVTYEYGGGPDGDVAISAINKSSALPGGVKVANPVATWGASRSETVTEGEQRISNFLRHKDRLVTAEDFREITRNTPGVDVARVEVLPLFRPNLEPNDGNGITNDSGSITVMVIPKHDLEQPDPPLPTKMFLQAVVNWLEPRRLITTQVFVRGPFFIPVVASLGIVTMAGQSRFTVHRRIKDALRRYLSPVIGGPESTNDEGQRAGTGWPLLNKLRPQDLMAVAARVEGVRSVEQAFLGTLESSGAIAQQSEIIMKGLQLPWLQAVDVQEGDATPLNNLANNLVTAEAASSLPVPLLPRKC